MRRKKSSSTQPATEPNINKNARIKNIFFLRIQWLQRKWFYSVLSAPTRFFSAAATAGTGAKRNRCNKLLTALSFLPPTAAFTPPLLQIKLAFLAHGARLFERHGSGRNHELVYAAGVLRAYFYAAHTGDTLFGVRRFRIEISIVRTGHSFAHVPQPFICRRPWEQAALPRLFIGSVAGIFRRQGCVPSSILIAIWRAKSRSFSASSPSGLPVAYW